MTRDLFLSGHNMCWSRMHASPPQAPATGQAELAGAPALAAAARGSRLPGQRPARRTVTGVFSDIVYSSMI